MIPKNPKIAKKSSKRQAFSGPKKHHETKKRNDATHTHFYDYEKSSPADCAKRLQFFFWKKKFVYGVSLILEIEFCIGYGYQNLLDWL